MPAMPTGPAVPTMPAPGGREGGEASGRSRWGERIVWYGLVFAIIIHSLTILSGFLSSDRIGFRGVGITLSLMMHAFTFAFRFASPLWLCRHLAHRLESRGSSIGAARLRRWSGGWRAMITGVIGLVLWFLATILTSAMAMPFSTGVSAVYFIGIPTLLFLIPLFGFISGFAELSYLRTLPDRRPRLLHRLASGDGRRLWNGGVFVALGLLFVLLQLMPERTVGVWAGPAILLLVKPVLFLLSMKELRHRFGGVDSPGTRELLVPAHLVSLCVLPFLFTIEVVGAGIPPIEAQAVQMFSPHGLYLGWHEMAEMSDVMLGLLLAGEVMGMVGVIVVARRGREDENMIMAGQAIMLRRAVTIGVLALLPLAAIVAVAVVDGPHVVIWASDTDDGDLLEIDVYPTYGQTRAILHIYTPSNVTLPAEVAGMRGGNATIRLLGVHGSAAAPDPGEFPIGDFFRHQGWIQIEQDRDIVVHEMIVTGFDRWELTFDVPYGAVGEDAPLKAMVRMVDENGTTLDWRISDLNTE